MKKQKLAILGTGFLGGIIARAWKDGFLPDYELAAVAGRNEEKTSALAAETGCRACLSIDEMLSCAPDIVAEAASVQAVRDAAVPVLSAGAGLMVLSAGAFADEAFRALAAETAKAHGGKLYIASGAVGGFDVLRTIALMGAARSGIETRKGPASLQNTPLYKPELMNGEEQVFTGSAKEAIALLPTKVNVAVAAALATLGPEHTCVTIRSVPDFPGDDHKITAEAPGVKAVVDVYSSTSAIAAWSVVAALQNLASPIEFV